MRNHSQRFVGGVVLATLCAFHACSDEGAPSTDVRVLRNAKSDRSRVSDDELQRVLAGFAARKPGSAALPAETIDLLIAVASDPKEEIRFSAIAALQAARDARTTATLAALAEKDPSELVRDEAKAVLETEGANDK